MRQTDRRGPLERFRGKIARGLPPIGGGAGTGIYSRRGRALGPTGRDRAVPRRADLVARRCPGGAVGGPGCHSFCGASSMERLPTERALSEQIRAFADIRRT